MAIFAKVILGLGILGILLGIAVAGVSAALVPLSDGRTSWDEAMFGIIPGVAVMVISFFLAVMGLIFLLMERKKAAR